jgi:hypothetical protein
VKHLSNVKLSGRLPHSLDKGRRVLKGTNTSLQRRYVNYGRKKFYDIWPWSNLQAMAQLVFFNCHHFKPKDCVLIYKNVFLSAAEWLKQEQSL